MDEITKLNLLLDAYEGHIKNMLAKTEGETDVFSVGLKAAYSDAVSAFDLFVRGINVK